MEEEGNRESEWTKAKLTCRQPSSDGYGLHRCKHKHKNKNKDSTNTKQEQRQRNRSACHLYRRNLFPCKLPCERTLTGQARKRTLRLGSVLLRERLCSRCHESKNVSVFVSSSDSLRSSSPSFGGGGQRRDSDSQDWFCRAGLGPEASNWKVWSGPSLTIDPFEASFRTEAEPEL